MRSSSARWLERLLGLLAVALLGAYTLRWAQHLSQRPGQPGQIAPGFKPVEAIPLEHGALSGCSTLLITLDTTRADRLGCYGHSGARTPVLDGLARRGVLFANAFTASPSTLPGHCSIHTGLYPYNHGARANGTFRLAPEQTTLAEVFQTAGYATAGFVSAYVLDSRFGLDQGFDLYDDDLRKGVRYGDASFRERPAAYTLEQALTFIETPRDAAFFVWVHLFDPHAPYLPPEPFRSEFARNPYDGEIASVDAELGQFLDRLDAGGLLENTLIVVAADHGEGLGEHGEYTHSLLLYDSTLHTPLIFVPPRRSSAKFGSVVTQQVSNVDIAPTILSLVGLTSTTAFDGELLNAEQTRPEEIYAETISTLVLHGWSPLFGLRSAQGKYIHAPKPEFYDLRRDPRELNNLLADRTQDVARYSQALERHIAGDRLGARALAQMTEMDAETARRLAALGYAGLAPATEIDATSAAGLNPRDMVPHFERVQAAQHLLATGRINDAIPEFEACLKTAPEDVWALRLLSAAYYDKGMLDQAEATLGRALQLETGEPGIYLALGQIALARQDVAAAEQRLRKALEVDPQYAPAFVTMGNLAAQRGALAEAQELYQRAANLDPGSTGPFAYNALAAMHYARGDISGARSAYAKSLVIDPLDGAAHAGLALLLLDEGKLDQAEELLLVARRYLPNDARVLATLAGIENQRGASEKALELANAALAIRPTHEQALNAQGAARLRLGDLGGAMASFEQALTTLPNYVPCILNLGQTLLAERREELALQMFERAVRINPGLAIAHFNIAAYYAQRGRLGEAESAYRRAVTIDPRYAIAHQHLGMLCYLQGRHSEALSHLEQSLALDEGLSERERVQEVVAQLRAQSVASQPTPPASP